MKVNSGPKYPAQFYVVTLASGLALAYGFVVTMLYRLRWIVAPVILFVLGGYLKFGWWIAVIAAGIFWIYLLPALMNSSAMAVLHFAPPYWNGPMTHPSFGRIRLLRFIMANWILLNYIALFLSSCWATKYVHPEASFGRAFLSVLCLALTYLIFAVIGLQFDATARSQVDILLCRRFKERETALSRIGLIPVLSALGTVSTVADPFIDNPATAPSDNPEDIPTLGIETISIENEVQKREWKRVIAERIEKADLIVVDVTNLSPSVAWELAEAVRRKGAERVVLVGAIQFLQTEGRSLRDRLMNELNQLADSDNLFSTIALPLAYSDDLSNFIFAWRMCCWSPPNLGKEMKA